MESIHGQVIACSDVHMISGDDERCKLLCKFLDRIDPLKTEVVILNGDIFDFCFGAKKYFTHKFARLQNSLNRLVQEKVRVYFVQGNHEFSLELLKWRGIEFVTGKGELITLSDGKKIAICHGDRLIAPWHYHIYLRITRSFIFRWLACLVPIAFLDRFALGVSAKSRSRDGSRRIDHKSILENAHSWLSSTGAQIGIIGHFHVPYHHKMKDQQILSMKSWDEPNFLILNNDQAYRLELNKKKQKFERKPL